MCFGRAVAIALLALGACAPQRTPNALPGANAPAAANAARQQAKSAMPLHTGDYATIRCGEWAHHDPSLERAYWSCVEHLPPRPSGIWLKSGPTTVQGRLPPEVIQRIVEGTFVRIGSCYETLLRRNPTVSGTVAMAFAISKDGHPQDVRDDGSTIVDSIFQACVADVFAGLLFPEPESKIVNVIYPIKLSVER